MIEVFPETYQFHQRILKDGYIPTDKRFTRVSRLVYWDYLDKSERINNLSFRLDRNEISPENIDYFKRELSTAKDIECELLQWLVNEHYIVKY